MCTQSKDKIPLVKTFVAIPSHDKANIPVGSDKEFIFAFVITCLLNIVGLLGFLCVRVTHAGHSGSVAGMAFNLTMWAIVVQKYLPAIYQPYSWYFWLLTAVGVLIMLIAFSEYVIKSRYFPQRLPNV